MSRAKAKSRTTRHFQKDPATEFNFGIGLWHSSVRSTIAAVALASLLATSAAPATASAFDPATMPSIDSIGAQTDITVFMRSGVPEELRLAALRRAWTMDPAIRDFKELAENDWDFNDMNSISGFAELVPEADVKTMLALMAGEAPRLAERSDEPRGPSFAANALRWMFNSLLN
jgi:Protein of unknown function (DUF3306)